MIISGSSLPLTKVEKEYLDGTRQFTKTQQRYIRCRLRKKLRLLNEVSCNVAAALSERSNAAAILDLVSYNEKGAGSGNFAFPSRREAREDNISNPRVLSDMGLAIPTLVLVLKMMSSGHVGSKCLHRCIKVTIFNLSKII